MTLSLKYTGACLEELLATAQEFPSALVVAMYDEAIASLAASIAAIESGDIAARFEATTQAIDIVTELHHALDLDQGAEISAGLSDLYRFIIAHIPMVNVLNDAAIAQEIIALLTPVRASWAALDDRIRWEVETAEVMDQPARVAQPGRNHLRIVATG